MMTGGVPWFPPRAFFTVNTPQTLSIRGNNTCAGNPDDIQPAATPNQTIKMKKQKRRKQYLIRKKEACNTKNITVHSDT